MSYPDQVKMAEETERIRQDPVIRYAHDKFCSFQLDDVRLSTHYNILLALQAAVTRDREIASQVCEQPVGALAIAIIAQANDRKAKIRIGRGENAPAS